eukprot:121081_1
MEIQNTSGSFNEEFSNPSNQFKLDTLEVRPTQANYSDSTTANRKRLNTYDFNIGTGKSNENSEKKLNSNDIEIISPASPNSIHTDHSQISDTHKTPRKNTKKFGTFDGVLARCLLCIWGVIMYLRTGWIVGNAGVLETTFIMILASSITTLTSLSLSAIVTNGEVKSGGYYYIISRSLGPSFGGVIGILFAFANCISVAMYLTGFAETLVALFDNNITGTGYDIQLFAEISLVLIFIISFRGVGSVIKFDMVLLVFLLISLVIFFIGTFTTQKNDVDGFIGYNKHTFKINFYSAYEKGENFVTVFSIFFPAVTGEMAGANISGNLRNPSYSIPLGTLSAIFISTFVYIIIAWILGASCDRDGLLNDNMLMSEIALFMPLMIVGIFSSTLSSGMSCFVGAPRIFQAVCKDNLFPSLKYFAKTRESDDEPIRCYFIGFFICFLAILSGDINAIAPIITNFFLVTYALMNYSCFQWSLTRSPGWRPTFKYFNKWISLFGCLECIAFMFFIDYFMALITLIIGVAMYKYIEYIDPKVNWGTASEAIIYKNTCNTLLKYQQCDWNHAKIQKPNFFLLNTNNVNDITDCYQIADMLNYAEGLIIVGNVLVGDHKDVHLLNKFIKSRDNKHKHRYIENVPQHIMENTLIESVIANTFTDGCRILFQTAGMSVIRPNVIIIKYSENINSENINVNCFERSDAAIDTPTQPIQPNMSSNASFSQPIQHTSNDSFSIQPIQHTSNDSFSITACSKDSFSITACMKSLNLINENLNSVYTNDNKQKQLQMEAAPLWFQNLRDSLCTECGVIMLKDNILKNIDNKNKNNDIDIWWLYDDGGLTVLIGYLLKKNIIWKDCNLRIMAFDAMGIQDQTELARLMQRFRIDAEIVSVVDDEKYATVINDNDYWDTKRKETVADLNSLIFNEQDIDDTVYDDEIINIQGINYSISEFGLKKIRKYAKIGKLIKKYSTKSKLCIITMPFPRKEYLWCEYYKIIQLLSPNNDVPAMFVRGNQTQVLTFAL